MVLRHEKEYTLSILGIQVQVPPMGLFLESLQDKDLSDSTTARTYQAILEQSESRRGDREGNSSKGLQRGSVADPRDHLLRWPPFEDDHPMLMHVLSFRFWNQLHCDQTLSNTFLGVTNLLRDPGNLFDASFPQLTNTFILEVHIWPPLKSSFWKT